MAFPPCLSIILPSLSLLRSACQSQALASPNLSPSHNYFWRLPSEASEDLHHTKLSETYHQRLPKTAWQHQVFEPMVESKESVCVRKKDLCLCCRLQRSGGDLSLTWTWTCAPVVVCLVAGWGGWSVDTLSRNMLNQFHLHHKHHKHHLYKYLSSPSLFRSTLCCLAVPGATSSMKSPSSGRSRRGTTCTQTKIDF